MMPAALGPVIPATSRVTVMLVCAEKKTAEFAREVTQGTLYAVKSDDRVWCHFRRSRPLQPEGRGG